MNLYTVTVEDYDNIGRYDKRTYCNCQQVVSDDGKTIEFIKTTDKYSIIDGVIVREDKQVKLIDLCSNDIECILSFKILNFVAQSTWYY